MYIKIVEISTSKQSYVLLEEGASDYSMFMFPNR